MENKRNQFSLRSPSRVPYRTVTVEEEEEEEDLFVFNDDDDDDPFIVFAETKFSICYIPVWARYSPLRTSVKTHAMTLSP